MRYILYARKSSESEDRQIQSIDDQLRVLRDCAARHDLKLVAELTEARSAKDPGRRPIFASMLEKIVAGEADAILCWSINRLARNPIDSGQLSWMLQQGTLKAIRTIDREYLPEDNVLLMAVESGVATQYILDLRKAVIRGMEGKAGRGWFPGCPPQGYRVNRESKEIEVVEPQFTLLRQAWDLALTGSYTIPQIRTQLCNWGYISHRRGNGKIFSESSLYRIFDNLFYYGCFKYRGQLYEGKHQPMVTRAEFDRVQQIIHGNVHVQPQKHEFAFTGLITCGNCGCSVTAERKVKYYKQTRRSVAYEYYHCTHKLRNCKQRSINGNELERQVDELIESITIDEAFGEWLCEVLDRDSEQEVSTANTKAALHQSATEANARKLSDLLELRLSKEISAQEYQEYKTQYLNDMAAKRLALQRERLEREALRNVIGLAAHSRRRYDSGNIKTKRQIVSCLARTAQLLDGQVAIEPYPLLLKVARLELLGKSDYQVHSGVSASKIPVRWAWRENIRTLVSEVKALSDEELTKFATLPNWDDARKTA